MKRQPYRFERTLLRKDPWRVTLTPGRKLSLIYYKPMNRRFAAPLNILKPWEAIEDIHLQLWDAWKEFLNHDDL